jgi:predicted Fe-Mo cluster-binding NifX family protein
MKIAVTYEDGEVFQHFGHCEEFKIYETKDGKVESSETVRTEGSGHGALAGFLKNLGAEVLICGGIGGGAREALAGAGIQLYPGVSGNADEAVQALLGRTLVYNPDEMCSHHHDSGTCGGHEDDACGHSGGGQCGEDRHGCRGSLTGE